MPERARQIRQRAHLLFLRDNPAPVLALDSTFLDRGPPRQLTVTEDVRRSYYERAERELIAEGKIKPA
jgi:hypothetical protein